DLDESRDFGGWEHTKKLPRKLLSVPDEVCLEPEILIEQLRRLLFRHSGVGVTVLEHKLDEAVSKLLHAFAVLAVERQEYLRFVRCESQLGHYDGVAVDHVGE